jgi:hypothetical protein
MRPLAMYISFISILAGMPGLAFAQKTFYIDETTDYTSATACSNITNVNTITASLETQLRGEAIPWTGSRYVNPNAWATDFWEGCSSSYGSGGQDGSYGDTGVLSVFAGHGDAGFLAFHFTPGTQCSVDFQANMRLGQMSGLQTGDALYLNCAALTVATIGTESNYEWVRQQFGWTNSISIGNNEPRDFYNATLNTINVSAWLDQMDGGGRHPIVITHGTSSSDVNNTRNVAKIKGNILRSQMGGAPGCGSGPPAFWYGYDTI